jgi:predicted tellurium resistance membrane protein TerC
MDIFLRLAADPGAWAALATLIVMEVVLGLDNLVFIALLSNRIDERRRGLARASGCRSRFCSAWRCSPRRRGRFG